MTLWNVAFPGFLIISSVSRIGNVMFLIIPSVGVYLLWVQWWPLK